MLNEKRNCTWLSQGVAALTTFATFDWAAHAVVGVKDTYLLVDEGISNHVKLIFYIYIASPH